MSENIRSQDINNSNKIFQDNAPRLHGLGIPIIPIDGKITFIEGWKCFSNKPIPKKLFNQWIQNSSIAESNLAIVLGRQSKLIAICFKNDNQKIKTILPQSLFEFSNGNKHVIRFYKYNGETSIHFKNIDVMICSEGLYVTIPPSINPDTNKNFHWVSLFGAFESDYVKRLVNISDSVLAQIAILNDKPTIKTEKTKTQNTKPKKEKILYKTDREDVIEEAIKEKSFFKTIKLTKFPEPTYYLKELVDACLSVSYVPRKKFALASCVASIGTILCNKVSLKGITPNTYTFFISGSGGGKDRPLNFPSTIFFKANISNYTGLGSYRSEKAIIKMFDEKLVRIDILDESTGLLKQFNSRNTSSALQNIAELLNTLYSKANSTDSPFLGSTTAQGTIGVCFNPCLNLLAATTPNGIEKNFTKENILQGFGARVLYIFDNEKQELKKENEVNMNLEFSEDLIEFLKYIDKGIGNKQSERKDISGYKLYKEGMVEKSEKDKRKERVQITELEKPVRNEVKISSELLDLLDDINSDYRDRSIELEKDDNKISPIYSRAFENLKKITLVHWASRAFFEIKKEEHLNKIVIGSDHVGFIDCNALINKSIKKEDIDWAKQYIDAMLCDAEGLLEGAIPESEFHRNALMVLKFIKKRGGQVTRSELFLGLRYKFKTQELQGTPHGIIPNMLDSAFIKETKEKGTGHKLVTVYKLIDK